MQYPFIFITLNNKISPTLRKPVGAALYPELKVPNATDDQNGQKFQKLFLTRLRQCSSAAQTLIVKGTHATDLVMGEVCMSIAEICDF
jgi:hypothetical protein